MRVNEHPLIIGGAGRRRLRAVLIAGSLIGAMLVPLTGDAMACASSHGRPYLTGFYGGLDVGSRFYAGSENGGSATVTLGVTPGHCVSQPGSMASYQTENGTAVGGEDYTAESETSQKLCADVDGPQQEDQFCPADSEPQRTFNVGIMNGNTMESAVEWFLVRLVDGTPAGLAEPTSAPIYIVDGDGDSRASLEPGVANYSRSESFARIKIPVFAAGNPQPPSIGYTVAPDPQQPATPGEDFHVVSPNPLTSFSDRVGFIELAIVNDKVGEGPESVIITLTGTVDGPSTTKVTIEDNEENEFPTSRLHHPRHKWKYKKSDYRIREVHIFTHDNEGGSGVTAAQFALRRNLKNGKCAWLTKKGWQKKDCQNKEWLDTSYDDVGELWRFRPKQLKSSAGTKIKNYTAFSRAIDGAGNIEKDFAHKRNDNTFEVKRSKKRRR